MKSGEGKIRRKLTSKGSVPLWLTLAFAIGLVFFFDIKGIQFYLVPSDSMVPTLMRSDYIGGFKIEPSELRRGGIVVFTSVRNDDDFYVKRVIGLPGDTVAILNGFVYVNGRRLEEPYVVHRGAENLPPLKIPKNRIFIMGDNRTNSVDSRRYGPVSTDQVEARITFIYNPISRIGGVE
jgi:signal peptidase I